MSTKQLDISQELDHEASVSLMKYELFIKEQFNTRIETSRHLK